MRRNEVRLIPTADPVHEARLRAWAAERGIDLIRARFVRNPVTGRPRNHGRPGVGRVYPRVCRHGHVIKGPADEQRASRGRHRPPALRCRQCVLEGYRRQYRRHHPERPLGRAIGPMLFPRRCKSGRHVLTGPGDETMIGDRPTCAACRSESQAKARARAKARRKSRTDSNTERYGAA